MSNFIGYLFKTGSMVYCRHNVVKNCPVLWERASEEQRKEVKLRFPEVDIKFGNELDSKTRAVAMRQRAHLVYGTMDSRSWKAHSSRQALCLLILLYEWLLGLYLHIIKFEV